VETEDITYEDVLLETELITTSRGKCERKRPLGRPRLRWGYR